LPANLRLALEVCASLRWAGSVQAGLCVQYASKPSPGARVACQWRRQCAGTCGLPASPCLVTEWHTCVV